MKKMMYLLNVNWGWIKQRPQYLAEEMAKKYDVDVWQKKEYKNTKTNLHVEAENLQLKELFRLPFESNNIVSKINYHMIARQLNKIMKDYDIVWLSDASYYAAMDVPKGKLLVYDCMDDNLEFPHIKNNNAKKNRFMRSEKKLLAACDVCIFSSHYLAQTIMDRYNIDITGKNVVINNAVKDEHNITKIKTTKNKDVFHICYVGTIASWMDFSLLEHSIKEIPGIVYDLYGPAEIKIPNNEKIIYHGVLEHDKVQSVLESADLLVMPFKRIPLVLSVNPVKLYEYIKSGRPSLAVKYAESERFGDFVSLYNDTEEYVSIIRKYKNNGWKPKYTEKDIETFIRENTWAKRGEDIRNILRTKQ